MKELTRKEIRTLLRWNKACRKQNSQEGVCIVCGEDEKSACNELITLCVMKAAQYGIDLTEDLADDTEGDPA